MNRVIFVDDEPKVLDGLKRMLYPLRTEWQMVFAGSGPEALQLMEQENFDVLVTDIQMPGMNGIELLTEVVKRHPQVFRIILSGTADQTWMLSSVLLAHQYLTKPCTSLTLKAALRRTLCLRDLLRDPGLKDLVSRIHALPSAPAAYARLLQATQSEDVSAAEIGRIVGQDMAMTAKILQLVNSSFFCLSREITGAEQAVIYLGIDTIRSLVLSVAAFSQFATHGSPRFSIEALQAHALEVATVASGMGKSVGLAKTEIDHIFTAGLLHDVGKLVLASNYPRQYDAILLASDRKDLSVRQAEQEVFGTTHAEVGAYLLWLWGLPSAVIEGIALHHNPGRSGEAPQNALLVHMADAMVRGTADSEIDMSAFATLDPTGELAPWQEISRRVLLERGRA